MKSQVIDYKKEHQKICNPNNNSVIVTLEWGKSGDNFKKLSTYDYSYGTVTTSNSTTLINK